MEKVTREEEIKKANGLLDLNRRRKTSQAITLNIAVLNSYLFSRESETTLVW